jgi:hypothetical protein
MKPKRRIVPPLVACLVAVLWYPPFTSAAPETRILNDFETPADLRFFNYKLNSAELSDQHVTHGQHSMKISLGEYLNSESFPKDWSGFDSVDLDVFVEGDAPVSGSILVADAAWVKSGGSYWNRHNSAFNLKPGQNTLSIPVNGLFRGEAGSRNNDLKSNIDPTQIIRVDIGFSAGKKPGETALYLDNLRLTRESRPAGILAFDLGPTSQTVAAGFTAIGPKTVYGQNGNAAGLDRAGSEDLGRDDTFPTELYGDYIRMDGSAFIAEVPEKSAAYHGWVVYDDLGYWGGEEADYRKRSIVANGEVVFSEDRGSGGSTDYLYRFEKTEPHPGDSLWELYMQYLFKPRRFDCRAEAGKIRLQFSADGGNSCKVAGIILYPDSIQPQAEKWIEAVEAKNRARFEARAPFLGPEEKKLDVPADARSKGYWLGFPTLEQDISFADAPGRSATPGAPALSRPAALGQRISFTFAIRPLKDLPGNVKLSASDLKSQVGATISANEIDLRYVHHAAHRGGADIAYTIGPDTLRSLEGAGLQLVGGLTRQFWITVHVPADAAPGRYLSTISLTAGDVKLDIPLAVDVLPFALNEPDYSMGFYGTAVPRAVLQSRGDDAWRDLFRTLKHGGMNSLSGGPNVEFSGLDAAGNPILDFAAADRFMQLAREAGFEEELNCYGGPGFVEGLHDSHAVGETGLAWEKRTGKPFAELLKIVWSAVRKHADEHHWLPIAYELVDEPRVLEQAHKNLELIRLYRENAPWVNVGGSYSVNWSQSDPFDACVQDIFKSLRFSSLNEHGQIDLAKAREFGTHINIYNQGTTRYSFGAYQWAEMQKGVTARMQWHVLALSGYQFFDLDGREPDAAMVNWTSAGLIPHIALHRCREGADDFRFAVTLHNLASKKDTPAARDALAWLKEVSAQIPINARERPEGFMNDETFRAKCIERIELLRQE